MVARTGGNGGSVDPAAGGDPGAIPDRPEADTRLHHAGGTRHADDVDRLRQ